MPNKTTANILTPRGHLIALLKSGAWRAKAVARGKASVPGGKNACAATASQPYVFDLKILNRINTLAEGLATDLKKTRLFEAIKDLKQVAPGDLVVCIDANGNGISDHVWHVVTVLDDEGTCECFDNRTDIKKGRISPTTYRRRLDGKDGYTPARGLLRLK